MLDSNTLIAYDDITKSLFSDTEDKIYHLDLICQNGKTTERVAYLHSFKDLKLVKLDLETYDLLKLDIRDDGIHGLVYIETVYHFSSESGEFRAVEPYIFRRSLLSIPNLREEVFAGNLYILWNEMNSLHLSREAIIESFYAEQAELLGQFIEENRHFYGDDSEVFDKIKTHQLELVNASIDHVLRIRDDKNINDISFDNGNSEIHEFDQLNLNSLRIFDKFPTLGPMDISLSDSFEPDTDISIDTFSEIDESLDFSNFDFDSFLKEDNVQIEQFIDPVDQIIEHRMRIEASVGKPMKSIKPFSVYHLRKLYTLIGKPHAESLSKDDLVNVLIRAIEDRLYQLEYNNQAMVV